MFPNEMSTMLESRTSKNRVKMSCHQHYRTAIIQNTSEPSITSQRVTKHTRNNDLELPIALTTRWFKDSFNTGEFSV